MKGINRKNRGIGEKSISIFEMLLLVISIVAFAYFIGNEFELVSAVTEGEGIVAPSVPYVSSPAANPGFPPVTWATDAGTAGAGVPTSGLGLGGTGQEAAELLAGGSRASGLGLGGTGQEAAELASGAVSGPGTPSAVINPTFWETSLGKTLTAVWQGVKTVMFHAGVAVALLFVLRYTLGLIPGITSDSLWKISGITAGAYLVGSLIADFGIIGPNLGMMAAMTTGLLYWALPALLLSFLIFFEKMFMEARVFSSYSWAPPEGGSYCGKCGEGIVPCTKYQCQSLGEGCEYLNEDAAEGGEGICIHTNPNDIDPPVIKPWNQALNTTSYSYSPDNTISPPDKGVTLKYNNLACGIPSYKVFSLGVQLTNNAGAPKLGRCKYSFKRYDTYEEMPDMFFSNRKLRQNHSLSFKLAGLANLEGEGLEGTGEYTLHVRCENKNGYANDESFVFKFCIDKGPDKQAPVIEKVSPENGKPVKSGRTSVETAVYTDEPAECRWSHRDEDFETMSGTMECDESMVEMDANMLYKCTATLDGLRDETENKFYFRCKDQPKETEEGDRNVHTTSYEYVLIGTRPLVIDSVTVNGFSTGALIKDSTSSVKVTLEVTTSAGYKDGQAMCLYKQKTEAENRYKIFGKTNSHLSTQELWFTKGTYSYEIKCCDSAELGGNCASQETEFEIDTDFVAPIIVRAYNEGNDLKIVTDEIAECVYDTASCSYTLGDGIRMISSDGLAHTTEWDTGTSFYIKCKDEYEVQPSQDACTIIVRPFNEY